MMCGFCGVVPDLLNSDIIVTELEFQLLYNVKFQTVLTYN